MELKALNTKEPAERGAFLHLRHPVFGHFMYAGDNVDEYGAWDQQGAKPERVGVTVRGGEAPSVRKELAELRRQRMKTKNADDDTETRQALEFVCCLVTAFHNVTNDGKELDGNNRDDKMLFFSQSEDLVLQVTRFAGDATNFFTKGSKN